MARNPYPLPPQEINSYKMYTVAGEGFVFMTSMTASQALEYMNRFTAQYGEVTVWTDLAGGRVRFWSSDNKIRIWYPSDNGIVRADAEAVVGHLPLHNHDIHIEDDSDNDDKPRKRCKLDF